MDIKDDFYFEKELRKIIKEKNIKRSKQTNIRKDEEYSNPYNPNYETEYDFMGCEKVSKITEDVLQEFDTAIELYYKELYKENHENQEDKENEDEQDIDFYEQYSIPFKEQFTDKKLYEEFRNAKLSDEEESYLKLKTFKSEHFERDLYVKRTFERIILRHKIKEMFSEEEIKKILEIIKNKMNRIYENDKRYAYFTKLLSDKPFGDNIVEEYENLIENETTEAFNRLINCGGYALKIDTTIFPPLVDDPYKAASSIVDTFKFVRLLEDKPLEDDEYLVFYRWYLVDGRRGHHFIRVDSDGVVREKNGVNEPQIFQNWAKIFQDSVQIAFAVKKEHKMFGYEWGNKTPNNGLNFEETAEKNIKERNNSFVYRNREYHFKKDSTGKIIITNDNKIIAEAIIDDDDCVVYILKGQKDYVENVSGFVDPIIKDGKLLNFDEFKKQPIRDDNDAR